MVDVTQNTENSEGAVVPSLSPFDDIENWLDASQFYHAPLPKEEIKAFQKRIDDCFGRQKDGESIFKLVWNGDRRFWHEYFYDWNSFGKGTRREKRPRILWKCPRVNKKDYVDMIPPRFLLLVRLEPEQYAGGWKSQSYAWDERMKVYKQIRDDEPPKVFYDYYKMIAAHDGYCCETAKANGENCFGKYRPPSDTELEELGALKRKLEAEKHLQSPYENLSKHTNNKIALWTRDFYRAQYRMTESTAEIIIENALDFVAPLTATREIDLSEREIRKIVTNAVRHTQERRMMEAEELFT